MKSTLPAISFVHRPCFLPSML
ncbi:hypothetical protein Golax_012182 [Gossypium laxum]|uniref:Uncharacterized protein n=3 Tax=Gossypium TaxID=3633 RepID=A0A7J9BUZ7_GOSGO|nr:hypothetical protein [Gossypium aridum]MBA0713138.1 hypothetical protein [Gossypium laxum]MBA0739978.1 hypothetical protein [Gossypium gossypioides]